MFRKGDRPIYIDVDGTLTKWPTKANGPVIEERVEAVRNLIEEGYQVVIWSGRGTRYARAFAERHGLEPLAALGKPEGCVDDGAPDIRPPRHMRVCLPGEFFS